jgi:tRNA-splicing ligase RtcB
LEKLPVLKNQYISIHRQVGTLGGGNHFIELQRAASDDTLWIMIHSGSRNIGKKIADQYGKIAKHWNELWYSETLPGLEFLPIETQYAKDYFNEMKYCVAFALANRQLMMSRICDIIHKQVGSATFEPMINIAHNYAAWENHFGEAVIVHRTGATRAYKGEIGNIPGSMGSHSYIVEGLGNPESFMSCSHGAGRLMGRKEAIRKLNLQDEIDFMNRQGIVHPITEQRQLDEAPSAYKDIDIVMQNQADLVRPIETLYPVAVVKG